jgi:hypothetical protein
MALIGASASQSPTVVLTGSEAVLLYDVDPRPEQPVAVRVGAGGDWRVTAILGGDITAGQLREEIVQRGVSGAAGRLGGAGKGCELSWQDGKEGRDDRR